MEPTAFLSAVVLLLASPEHAPRAVRPALCSTIAEEVGALGKWDGETNLLRFKRGVLGGELADTYSCDDDRIVAQLTTADFPSETDARDYWHRLLDLLTQELGPPCIDASVYHEDAELLFPDLQPEDRFARLWRLGPDRLMLSIHSPPRSSSRWTTGFAVRPWAPTYRVAPDGTRSQMPEPACTAPTS